MSNGNSYPPSERQPTHARLPGSDENHSALTLPQAMQQAAAFYSVGEWAKAGQLCRLILNSHGSHFDALSMLGIIAAQTGHTTEAADLLRRAVAARPDDAIGHLNYGNALQALQRFEAALESYERVLQLEPTFAEAYFNRGNIQRDLKRYEAALESYERALQLKPDHADAFNNRGNALQDLRRFEAALDSYEHALRLKPDYADAFNNRGVALYELKRFEAALDSYAHALQLKPDDAETYFNRGNVQRDLKRFEAALESYQRALQLKPDYAEAYFNRGNALQALRRFDEALDSYAHALQLKPDYAAVFNNSGVALSELKRFEAALESYERALQLKPDYVEAYFNRGNVQRDLERLEAALESYQRGLHINPTDDLLYGTLLHTNMLLCAWQAFDPQVSELASRIEAARRATPPFPVLALIDCLSLQRRAADTWVHAHFPECRELSPIRKRGRRPRIRLGYYSSDFHEHATAYLAAELFERHDKSRFELVAFSYGPDARGEMRRRLATAFHQFIDARTKSDKEVAQLSRELQIDIAVDLKGFTKDARIGIFAYRAAPVQVSYLGYPGTTGAPYMDYIIADHTLVPDDSRYGYSEKVVYLPHSYQVNDRQRPITAQVPARTELGLPATGFVFCCFNNTFKIAPPTFDVWMRILKRVEGSVLWLKSDTETAVNNLRTEAQARGVSAARLIFAPHIPLPDHLARHRAADLFLDTLPYNAHTTASDALWAGLPLLTRMGESFAARVAASLLNAIGLPELIATTPEQYEALAVGLASSPARLAEVREKLHRNRLTTPLFDTTLFAKHIEAAYVQMYERYQADLSPDHISVVH